jgi:hypothetical protein
LYDEVLQCSALHLEAFLDLFITNQKGAIEEYRACTMWVHELAVLIQGRQSVCGEGKLILHRRVGLKLVTILKASNKGVTTVRRLI